MRLSIQDVLLPGKSLQEKFENAARYGFDGVEVVAGPGLALCERAPEIERASKAGGVPVAAICPHPTHDPLMPDPDERGRRFEQLRELLACVDALGAAGIICVPVRLPHRFEVDDWAKRYEVIGDIAVGAFRAWAEGLPGGKARIFLEPLNRYEAYFLNRLEQAVALCRRIDHPRVQMLGDLFHMNIEEIDLGEPFRAAGAYLGHVHIADNNRYPPGYGMMDYHPAFAALKAIGYPGYVSVECWPPDGAANIGAPEAVWPATVRFLREVWENA
ncbi:MAG: sugar phosphate isomerase/epimerase [Anaerolineae bacterium]|nr:sugar phosphate isomerase/epimerase [Anaerolineae bacterium]